MNLIAPIFVVTCFLGSSATALAADDDVLTLGKVVYDDWCGICHAEDDKSSGGGTQALQTLYQGTIPAKLEDRTDMTAEFITELVRKGRLGMPNFRLTEISEKELEAVIAYLTRNNDEGGEQ